MKKVTTLAIIGLSAIALTACSSGSDSKKMRKHRKLKQNKKHLLQVRKMYQLNSKTHAKKQSHTKILSIFQKQN